MQTKCSGIRPPLLADERRKLIKAMHAARVAGKMDEWHAAIAKVQQWDVAHPRARVL
jgi:hypothetical protein